MLYSGYIAKFAGGYGGLLLSHFGFTVLDFLALIPTVLILLFESAVTLIGFLIKQISLYIVLPFAALFFAVNLFNNFNIPTLSSKFQLVGAILWLIPTLISTTNHQFKFHSKNKTVFVIISIIGMVLLGMSTPYQTWSNNTNSFTFFSNDTSLFGRLLTEMLSAIITIYIVASPSLIGLSLATTAINNKTLSKVENITTKQPLDFPGTVRKLIDGSSIKSSQQKKHWLLNKEIPLQFGLEAFSYSWNDDEAPFLIASFSRTTAFYFISKSPLKQNKMLLVSNDLIYSIELQSKAQLENTIKG